MKKLLVLVLSVTLLVVLGLSGMAWSAPIIYAEKHGDSATPGDFEITVGPTFSLDFYIQYLPGDVVGIQEGLFAAGVGAEFSGPGDISHVRSSFDYTVWEEFPLSEDTLTLNKYRNNLAAQIPENFYGSDIRLGAITFLASATGDYTVKFFDPDLDPNPTESEDYWDWGAYPDGIVFDSCVDFTKTGTIHVVPIPGTLLLFCSGLIGLAGLKIRGSRGKAY